MSERRLVRTLPIIAVDDEHVMCGGAHPTADGKGLHTHLQPRFLLSELALGAKPPKVGDSVHEYDDGTREHVSR